MKVLVCHNRYRSNVPSGENRYVDDEIALLRANGIDVIPLIEENDSIVNDRLKLANAALGIVYSPTGVRRFDRLLREERPDIVHLHNVFPLISPHVIRLAKAAGVPVVQRVHNHEHTCISGAHFRGGLQCDDCLGRRIAYPGIQHGCYRGSRPLSAAKVLAQTAHRNTWRMVDKFLVHTPFAASRLLTKGIDKEQIEIFTPYAADPGEPTTDPGQDFLFVGRLDEGKGIALLLAAWRARTERGARRLRVAGTGPLEDLVRSMVRQEDDIDYLGYLERSQVNLELQRCGIAVVPSLYYEPGLPLAAIEALAHGRPIIVNDGTSFSSVVSDEFGWCIEPNIHSWSKVIDAITQDDLKARGSAARKEYVNGYSPPAAIASLTRIYTSLLGPDM
jgi:glycosyltransferase involved in cell wall biosynthesis